MEKGSNNKPVSRRAQAQFASDDKLGSGKAVSRPVGLHSQKKRECPKCHKRAGVFRYRTLGTGKKVRETRCQSCGFRTFSEQGRGDLRPARFGNKATNTLMGYYAPTAPMLARTQGGHALANGKRRELSVMNRYNQMQSSERRSAEKRRADKRAERKLWKERNSRR